MTATCIIKIQSRCIRVKRIVIYLRRLNTKHKYKHQNHKSNSKANAAFHWTREVAITSSPAVKRVPLNSWTRTSGEVELGSCNSSLPLVIWRRMGLKVRSVRKSWTRDYHLVIASSPVQWNTYSISAWSSGPSSRSSTLFSCLKTGQVQAEVQTLTSLVMA